MRWGGSRCAVEARLRHLPHGSIGSFFQGEEVASNATVSRGRVCGLAKTISFRCNALIFENERTTILAEQQCSQFYGWGRGIVTRVRAIVSNPRCCVLAQAGAERARELLVHSSRAGAVCNFLVVEYSFGPANWLPRFRSVCTGVFQSRHHSFSNH